MKLNMKMFIHCRYKEYIKFRNYKKNYKSLLSSFTKLDSTRKILTLNKLLKNKEYNLLIATANEDSWYNKKYQHLSIKKEAALKLNKLNQSNPQAITKLWNYFYIQKKRRSNIFLKSIIFLLILIIYPNRDVFFEKEIQEPHDDPVKMVEGNKTKPKKLNKNWSQDLMERIQKNKTKIEVFKPNKITERFYDVKGIDEIRAELEEVVKILKNPEKYEAAGAKLMKGILLVGKPGTGKTLLARSLAGESGVNFIYTTASEFDQKFVGLGSRKLKKLFQKARENSPCIIFIDEIDSLLDKAKRKSKYSTSYDRSDLNTFLAEMDGFKKNEHIFILGATNSLDSLDEAALRPGRFDKVITVPLPDKKGRNEIFSLYLKKIKLLVEPDINSHKLSEMTPGFSGAEIENMVNLATILAVDTHKNILNKSSFEEARDRQLMGIKLKSNKNLRYMLQRAVHEAGHTLICYHSPLCRRDIHKVTIAKRGFNEGKTSILPDENFSGTREEFETFIQVSLAGLIAEEIYFGSDKVSTGCGNDLSRASSLAKDMVTKYAMNSRDFGYMFINEGYIVDHRISSETRNSRDVSIDSIIVKAQQNVRHVLNENSAQLKALTQNLLEYDELEKEEIEKIMSSEINIDNKFQKNKNKVRNVNIDEIF
jgi:ATP-dependent metalloprotease FtsH